jgi:photosystem II stability/assembly factor-like uncharacterized protein
MRFLRPAFRCSSMILVGVSLSVAIACVTISKSLSSALGGRASQQSFPSPHNPVGDIFFTDATQGWALVEASDNETVILATVDAGQTWTELCRQIGLYKLCFLNSLQGWASALFWDQDGKTGKLYLMETVDGGKTWKRLSQVGNLSPSGHADFVSDFLFVDRMHGWVIGDRGGDVPVFLETSNGGREFFEPKGVPQNLMALARILSDADGRICVLGSEFILRSLDRGRTWSVALSGVGKTVSRLDPGLLRGGHLFRDGRWVVVGSGARILLSPDFGAHWKAVFESAEIHDLIDVSFSDEQFGCAVGGSTLLACTDNGGNSWTVSKVLPESPGEKPFLANSFKRIVLLANGSGWVISQGGYLYETADAGRHWQEVRIINKSKAD